MSGHEPQHVRHGFLVPISLSLDDAGERYACEPAAVTTPETLYGRRWALMVIERARHASRRVAAATARASVRGAPQLSARHGPAPWIRSVAATLAISEGAVNTAVHRLRRQFRTQLQQDIAETVADPSEMED